MYLCSMKFSCRKKSFFIIAMTMALGAMAQPRAKYLQESHDFGKHLLRYTEHEPASLRLRLFAFSVSRHTKP